MACQWVIKNGVLAEETGADDMDRAVYAITIYEIAWAFDERARAEAHAQAPPRCCGPTSPPSSATRSSSPWNKTAAPAWRSA